MTADQLRQFLPSLKEQSLAGESAHRMLAPEARRRFFDKHTDYQSFKPKQAAVMLLIFPDAREKMHLAFIKRHVYPGVHSDQIGFPGGKREETDAHFWHTALRETQEEVGISAATIQLIRPLSTVYIPPSNFEVFPFLAHCTDTPNWQLSPDEVQELIALPVAQLFDQQWLIEKELTFANDTKVLTPGFQWESHFIWGATAMMLQELRMLLAGIN
ncbi:MAG: coenzyme A pyrophosphatase [Flavobacterium sp. BFFFF2]|nr:MAG: coenzyme A pyrophosphatase [Flavobacterium sp. BFFFF2]